MNMVIERSTTPNLTHCNKIGNLDFKRDALSFLISLRLAFHGREESRNVFLTLQKCFLPAKPIFNKWLDKLPFLPTETA